MKKQSHLYPFTITRKSINYPIGYFYIEKKCKHKVTFLGNLNWHCRAQLAHMLIQPNLCLTDRPGPTVYGCIIHTAALKLTNMTDNGQIYL